MFCRSQGHRKGASRALGKKGYRNGRRHFPEYLKRIESPGQEENRNHNKELDHVTANDNSRVFSQGSYNDTRFNLGRKLGSESQNTNGKNEKKSTNQGEKQLLESHDSLHKNVPVFRFWHESQTKTKGSSNHHHCQHIAGQEGLQQVIGDNAQNMVIIGKVAQFLRYVGCTGTDNISRKIARCNP